MRRFFIYLFSTLILIVGIVVVLEAGSRVTWAFLPEGWRNPVLFSKLRLPFTSTADEARRIVEAELPSGTDSEFDPVLGFRNPALDAEIARFRAEAAGKKKILILGGSTTAGPENWPKYLPAALKEAGIDENVVLLNAGTAGYGTFQELLLASRRILPALEREGVRPDLVITLDGVQDVADALARPNGNPFGTAEYPPAYEKIDEEHRRLLTLGGTFGHFTGLVAKTPTFRSVTSGVLRVLPYSTSLVLALRRPKATSPAPAALSKTDQQALIRSVTTGLKSLAGYFEWEGIPFIGFLQPVLLTRYYPLASKREKAESDWEKIYPELEEIYGDLRVKDPGAFHSLAHEFASSSDERYAPDAVHYTAKGSEALANAIARELKKQGKLERPLDSALPRVGRLQVPSKRPGESE